MVRKKHNLLTSGLTSELFLLAFLEPSSARKLGQRLQNTTKNPTNYSKVHPAVHDLTTSKYLKHNEKERKFYPNISKLVDELSEILEKKNIILSKGEKNSLQDCLERIHFLKIMTASVVNKLQNQPKGIHKINALDVFCETIGTIASGLILLKENKSDFGDLEGIDVYSDETFKELDNFFNSPDLENKMEEIFQTNQTPEFNPAKNIMLSFFKSLIPMMNMMSQSNEFLKKISNLWSSNEVFFGAIELKKHLDKT